MGKNAADLNSEIRASTLMNRAPYRSRLRTFNWLFDEKPKFQGLKPESEPNKHEIDYCKNGYMEQKSDHVRSEKQRKNPTRPLSSQLQLTLISLIQAVKPSGFRAFFRILANKYIGPVRHPFTFPTEGDK